MRAKNLITWGLVQLMVFHSASTIALGAPVAAKNTSALLLKDVKKLQSAIDSNKVKPAFAIDEFSKAIGEHGVTKDDVFAFAKTQMTRKQYDAFVARVQSALRGIDESTLTQQEFGEIVGQALAGIHAEGLYWSGCASLWTGAAIVAAAIVTGIIAIGKSKSSRSIQDYWDNKIRDTKSNYDSWIANTRNNYNSQINDTRNWQLAYPQRINDLQNRIRNYQDHIHDLENDIDDLRRKYDNATTQTDKDRYSQEIRDDKTKISDYEDDITSAQNSITNYTTKMAVYASNPVQAETDAHNLEVQRDNAIADLERQEPIDLSNLEAQKSQALADAPSNQAFGRKLGLGAGIGAAIGAGLLVAGINAGGCQN